MMLHRGALFEQFGTDVAGNMNRLMNSLITNHKSINSAVVLKFEMHLDVFREHFKCPAFFVAFFTGKLPINGVELMLVDFSKMSSHELSLELETIKTLLVKVFK